MTKSRWVDLENCPFCGSPALQPVDVNRASCGTQHGHTDWIIRCPSWCCVIHGSTKKECVNLWNTRSDKPDDIKMSGKLDK